MFKNYIFEQPFRNKKNNDEKEKIFNQFSADLDTVFIFPTPKDKT